MYFEWEYDSQWDWKWKTREWNTEREMWESKTINNHDENRRGLRGRLEYDKTFYIALIKNYQDIGWLDEADDCYYTYRVEKRRNRIKEKQSNGDSVWFEQLEYIVFDFPFGYGVKPFKLLRSFFIFWLPFSLFYAYFLRLKEGIKPCPNWTSSDFVALGWASLHSLNTLTPGIDFHSLTDPFLEDSQYELSPNRGDVKAIVIAQRLQQVFGWYLLALFFMLFGEIWIR